MRINIGATTKNIEMKTPTNFASAIKSPLLTPSVVSAVTSSAEHTALIKLLNSTSRPYAICVLSVK